MCSFTSQPPSPTMSEALGAFVCISKKRQASTDIRHVCISEVRITTSPESLSIYAEIWRLTARVLTLGTSILQQEGRNPRTGDSFCMELGVRVACLWLPRWLPSGISSCHPIQEVASCTLKYSLLRFALCRLDRYLKLAIFSALPYCWRISW